MDTIQHIALTDLKASDVERLILPRGHSGLARPIRLLRQIQQGSQRTPAQPPGARSHLRLPLVVERDCPVPDVEAEPLLPERQAPLVPEAAAHGHVSGAQPLDLETELPGPLAVQVVFPARSVRDVAAVDVGHDVRHPGFGGRGDDLAVRGGGSAHGEGDDEELLAAEGGDEGFVVIFGFVVYCDGFEPGWKGAGAGAG